MSPKDDNESQSFNIELAYPKRSLSTLGWYAVTENTFDSDLTFKWNATPKPALAEYDEYTSSSEQDTAPRIMRAALQWRNEPLQGNDIANQSAMLTIRHPSFQKDVTFRGELYRNPIDLIKTKFELDYCDDPDHFLSLKAILQDLSTIVGYRNYSFEIIGLHPISELDLYGIGSIGARPDLYETHNIGRYKRGYMPVQDGKLIGLLNLKENEIHLWVY